MVAAVLASRGEQIRHEALLSESLLYLYSTSSFQTSFLLRGNNLPVSRTKLSTSTSLCYPALVCVTSGCNSIVPRVISRAVLSSSGNYRPSITNSGRREVAKGPATK